MGLKTDSVCVSSNQKEHWSGSSFCVNFASNVINQNILAHFFTLSPLQGGDMVPTSARVVSDSSALQPLISSMQSQFAWNTMPNRVSHSILPNEQRHYYGTFNTLHTLCSKTHTALNSLVRELLRFHKSSIYPFLIFVTYFSIC